MADLTDIYNSRHRVGHERQPRHTSFLTQLDQILRAALAEQPYKFSSTTTERTVMGEFIRLKDYSGGSSGYEATISGTDFIYRLSGVKKLATGPSLVWHSRVKADAPDRELFRLIEEDYKGVGEWLDLSRYCTGQVSNYRNLTWWTTFDPNSMPINDAAHLLGLTNNVVDPFSVVLRFPATRLLRSNTRVPTAIDAFICPVFHPTRDVDKPRSGTTIDLRPKSALVEGADEFVLRTVNVTEIQLIPIFISNRITPYLDSDDDPALWQLLYDYYAAL